MQDTLSMQNIQKNDLMSALGGNGCYEKTWKTPNRENRF